MFSILLTHVFCITFAKTLLLIFSKKITKQCNTNKTIKNN